jgi:hypothetical protein
MSSSSSSSLDRQKAPPLYSPPCHEDRLIQDLAIHSRNKHATQLLPEPVNLGQGDPLMTAVVDHWKHQASQDSHRSRQQQSIVDNIEIEDKRSYRRHHRHHSRKKQMSVPDMSKFQLHPLPRKEEKEQQDNKGAQGKGGIHQVDHLIEHGTPFAGMGMNDVVHLENGTVMSVPILSSNLIHQVTSHDKKQKPESGNQRRHSMPNLFGSKKDAPPHHHSHRHHHQQQEQQEQQQHDHHHHHEGSKDRRHHHHPPPGSGTGTSKTVMDIAKHIGHGTIVPLH